MKLSNYYNHTEMRDTMVQVVTSQCSHALVLNKSKQMIQLPPPNKERKELNCCRVSARGREPCISRWKRYKELLWRDGDVSECWERTRNKEILRLFVDVQH